MNTGHSTVHAYPEVTTFVDLVRLFLGDLDDETRDELTGGLEADLADLVSERGVDELPDPEVYADELRAAAGLPPRSRWSPKQLRPRVGLDEIIGRLDAVRARFLAWAGAGRRQPVWELLVAMRPVWWVARAWAALQLLDLTVGAPPHRWVPELGVWPVNVALLAGAVLVSVQLGRGVWWPGGDRSDVGRLLVIGANLTALVAIGPAVHMAYDSTYWDAYDDAETYRTFTSRTPGQDATVFRYDGKQVCDLTVTDRRTGRPLQAAVVTDQRGRPLPRGDFC